MKPQRRCLWGFTLLELLTVIVLIALLASMIIPIVTSLQSKAERAQCVTNLRSLYVAASARMDQQQEWPQIPASLIKSDPATYAHQWNAALEPHGISPHNWICRTVQRGLGNPDYRERKTKRVDYLATPFDDNPASPRKYPTHPWFLERGDVHGDGNLVIFANGQVKSLTELLRERR